MRVALLVMFAGCWSGPTPVSPVTVVTKSTRCEIHDRDLAAGVAALSIQGTQFAQLGGPFSRLDVTFTGATATARVETTAFVLEGELDLGELPLRPRELDLQQGWLEIRAATGNATGDTLRLEAALPLGLEPASQGVELPCKALTFAAPPEPPESTIDPELVMLLVGTQLRATPTGPAIARVVGYETEEDGPGIVEGSVLERRGSMTRVLITGKNHVSVWAATAALQPSSGNMLGGFGFGRSGFSKPEASCPRDVSIYLRLGDAVVRVGRIKRDAMFYTDGQTGDDVTIDLGPLPEGPRPFIKQSDYARCK